MLNKINAYTLLDKTRMRSYASQEKSANVKKKTKKKQKKNEILVVSPQV